RVAVKDLQAVPQARPGAYVHDGYLAARRGGGCDLHPPSATTTGARLLLLVQARGVVGAVEGGDVPGDGGWRLGGGGGAHGGEGGDAGVEHVHSHGAAHRRAAGHAGGERVGGLAVGGDG